MLTLTADEIAQRIFTAKADLPKGIERIPLKTLHINKCPIVAPAKVLRASDAARLNIDISQCQNHSDLIMHSKDLISKLNTVFSGQQFALKADNLDPDLMIYSGGFFSAQDKSGMKQVRTLASEELADFTFQSGDSRLNEMLFRYRARNYPDSLDNNEKIRWRKFCRSRLNDGNNQGFMDFSAYQKIINELKHKPEVDSQLIQDLENYASDLQKRIQE